MTDPVLPAEIVELRARLREAEELVRAIGSGAVDAVVVERHDGEATVYTLTGADRPYRELVESMSEGAVIVDDAGTILFCNRALAALVGDRLERIVGGALDRFFPDGTGGGVDGEGRHDGIELLTTDGRRVPVAVSRRRISFDEDEFVAVVVTDLSGQRLQQRLAESEARFRSLFEQTPLAVQVFDPAGNTLRVNPAFVRTFGEREAAPGYNIFGDPRVDLGGHRERLERMFAGEVTTAPATRYLDPAGVPVEPELWLEFTGFPVKDAAGEVRELVLVAHDVTARVAAEQAARRTEREATRQKDDFIAILAHELRNPLAPIRNSVGILRARGTSDPMSARCHDIIERQLSHMARLLDDLLDVSRLARGTLKLQLGPVTLASVLDAALELALPLIEQKRHELVVEGLDQPILLDADGARLTQVFGNLLVNAAKYSEPGGHIRVTVAREGGSAVIRVRDRGMGIPPEMVERIFELFAQAEEAREGQQSGLGIGLSLARRLVEMHGGSIHVASDGPGRGSEFTVTIPTML